MNTVWKKQLFAEVEPGRNDSRQREEHTQRLRGKRENGLRNWKEYGNIMHKRGRYKDIVKGSR